ncbi:zinc finger MYM-type protein 5-like [Argiope bruennichi]|uniref:zinc finger MYM-type protein 5-like n=1 Tax=Argiope bruennichi TaxID=94029 RepID=UPI0024957367|nr:zinc finger MYM-type protein 5-like [Argiope bruennichi]
MSMMITLPNGEKVFRNYLIYSNSRNAVFCFPCKLFSEEHSHLIKDGWDQIQNEIISIISEGIKRHLLHMIKSSKYYSLILDSTLDVSHTEQALYIPCSAHSLNLVVNDAAKISFETVNFF